MRSTSGRRRRASPSPAYVVGAMARRLRSSSRPTVERRRTPASAGARGALRRRRGGGRRGLERPRNSSRSLGDDGWLAAIDDDAVLLARRRPPSSRARQLADGRRISPRARSSRDRRAPRLVLLTRRGSLGHGVGDRVGAVLHRRVEDVGGPPLGTVTVVSPLVRSIASATTPPPSSASARRRAYPSTSPGRRRPTRASRSFRSRGARPPCGQTTSEWHARTSKAKFDSALSGSAVRKVRRKPWSRWMSPPTPRQMPSPSYSR